MISDTKLLVASLIIRHGYHAFFSDVDLVFIQDPWPTLHLKVDQSCKCGHGTRALRLTHGQPPTLISLPLTSPSPLRTVRAQACSASAA